MYPIVILASSLSNNEMPIDNFIVTYVEGLTVNIG